MNKNRIYSLLFLLLTLPGFVFMSINQGIIGMIFIGTGVIPGTIFLHKARGEEQ